MPRGRFPEYAAFVAKYNLEYNIKRKLNNCALERVRNCESINLYHEDIYVASTLENEDDFDIGFQTVEFDYFIKILERLDNSKARSLVDFGMR